MSGKRSYLLLAIAACAVDGDDLEVDTAEVIGGCPEWGCGTNSPIVDGTEVTRLHERGLQDPRSGFSITSFTKLGIPYTLDVTNGKITGTHWLGTLQGAALVDAVITLQRPDLRSYDIRITAVGSAPYFITGAVATYETYLFDWKVTGAGQGTYRNLCALAHNNSEPTLGMDMFHTLVFEGEKIKPNKTIANLIDNDWFNIGCAGHALAKLALTGHVAAAAADGYVTTIAERQTFLKMITAAYCSNGTSFTIAGERLDWTDDLGWMPYPPGLRTLEARWGPNGAICLNEPRLANPTNPALAAAAYPAGIEAAILAQCGSRPSYCADGDANKLAGAHLVTGNPPP